MRMYSRNKQKADGAVEPTFEAALRHVLPTEFLECIDESRFEYVRCLTNGVFRLNVLACRRKRHDDLR